MLDKKKLFFAGLILIISSFFIIQLKGHLAENKERINLLNFDEKNRELLIELLGTNINEKLDLDTMVVKENVIVNKKIIRQKIYFSSTDNVVIPCYLFTPTKINKKTPAILIAAGHGNGIVETANMKPENYQHGNAQFLAEKGYVTLTCENRGFGELIGLGGHHAYLHNKYGKRSYLGMILEDHRRAIDYLQSLPYVDENKIGAAGVSLGGEIVLSLSAIDKRIKSSIVMGYLTSNENLKIVRCPCGYIPDWEDKFSMGKVGSLIRPRSVLFVNGNIDESTPSHLATEEFDIIREKYAKINKEENAIFIEYDGGHVFVNSVALEFFDSTLK